jgi:predicted Fe-Mo cluster-binding NifX family protein
MEKILLTLSDRMIAPRFDLATEVLIVSTKNSAAVDSQKSMLLPGPSADDLCGLVLKEDITVLICGGIEEEHYQFLTWKKVRVFDRVIGEADEVIAEFLRGTLQPGAIVMNRKDTGADSHG